MNDHVLRDFLQHQCRSKFMVQRPSLAHMVQKLSLAALQTPLSAHRTPNSNDNQRVSPSRGGRQAMNTKEKAVASDPSANSVKGKVSFCREVLKANAPVKTAPKRSRQRKPVLLSTEEKVLFDEEELLSSSQDVIANACGLHRHRPQMKLLQQQQSIKPPESTESSLLIHRFCRKGAYPGTTIQRQQIEDSQVPWTVKLPDYKPPYYTQVVSSADSNDVDPEIISSKFMWNTFDANARVDRRTANPVGDYPIDAHGYPLNPLGRTGLSGRGELRRWAVNYQTHLVILIGTSEMKSGKEVFSYMMQKPIDHHHYRLPSTWTTGTTMAAITKTLKIFLMNIYRSWNNEEKSDSSLIEAMIEHLTFVSTAYIDDSRNTDNAWLETSVCCYVQSQLHPGSSSNKQLDLRDLFPDASSDNKTEYQWVPINRNSQLLDSERDVVKLIAHRYNTHW